MSTSILLNDQVLNVLGLQGLWSLSQLLNSASVTEWLWLGYHTTWFRKMGGYPMGHNFLIPNLEDILKSLRDGEKKVEKHKKIIRYPGVQ